MIMTETSVGHIVHVRSDGWLDDCLTVEVALHRE